MPETLEERVIRVIAKAQHIPREAVSLDSKFEDLNIDSLDGLQILFALEEEFNINIPDDAGQRIRSVRQAVDGVAALVEGTGESVNRQ